MRQFFIVTLLILPGRRGSTLEIVGGVLYGGDMVKKGTNWKKTRKHVRKYIKKALRKWRTFLHRMKRRSKKRLRALYKRLCKVLHKKNFTPVGVVMIVAVSVIGGSFAVVYPQLYAAKKIATVDPVRAMLTIHKPNTIEQPFDFPEDIGVSLHGTVCAIDAYGAQEGAPITDALMQAIDDCATKGGGIVMIGPGEWTTGPIELKSNIVLYVAQGATVHFSENKKDFLPVVFSRYEGIELYNYKPLVRAANCHDVAIIGGGVLDGAGEAVWWADKETSQRGATAALYQMVIDDVPVRERIFGGATHGLRPSFVQFINCQNVLIKDVVLRNSPMWTVHPIYTDGVGIDNVTIETADGPNTDGIAIDSSRNVLIMNSTIDSGDDDIAIKSGLDKDGWRVGKPSENIVIANMTFLRGNSGSAIGSEMSGDVRNVYAGFATLTGTKRGLRIKSKEGRGGVMENIWFEHMTMDNIQREALIINMDYDPKVHQALSTAMPTLRNAHFSDLTVSGAENAISVVSTPDILSDDITFANITATTDYGVSLDHAADLTLRNVCARVRRGSVFTFTDSQHITLDGYACATRPWSLLRIVGNDTQDIALTLPSGLFSLYAVPVTLREEVHIATPKK